MTKNEFDIINRGFIDFSNRDNIQILKKFILSEVTELFVRNEKIGIVKTKF